MDKLAELMGELKALMGKFGIAEHPGAEEEGKEAIADVGTDADVTATEEVTEDNEAGNAAAELFALIDTVNDKELAAKIKGLVGKMTGEEVTVDADPAAAPEAKPEEKKEEPPAMDENAVNKIVAAKLAAAEAKTRGKLEAARVVAPIVGEMVDPLTFDSAESIYKKALELQGIDTTGYAPSAYRGMVDMLRRQSAPAVGFAQDSARDEDKNELSKYFKNIRIEN